MNDNNEQNVKRAYSLFHVLWGDSKDKVYSKQLWSDLQSLLSEIICVKPFRIHPDHKTIDQIQVLELESENTALKLENERLKEANAILLKMH